MHSDFLSGLIAASVALTSFLTQLQHQPAKQIQTPDVSITAAPSTQITISPVKAWKTVSNQYISFKYPSDWVLDTKITASGIVYSVKEPVYAFTQGLPLFSVAITDKAKWDKEVHVNSSMSNFLDPFATYSSVKIDNHSAKRARLGLDHGRWIKSEDVTLFVPEKNIYVKMGMYDVGINFEEQIHTWFNPLVNSIQF